MEVLKMENETIRINIRMSKELKEWYFNNASKDGIPGSALMVMALREYKKQCEGMVGLNQLEGLVKQLENIPGE